MMVKRPRPRGWLGSFVRSFSVQGSWSYRSMLGSGLAFCLLPMLRGRGLERDELRAAMKRHLESFNSHPYLFGVALGAVARMEEDGVDPERIHRFKEAIQGSLGGLGDFLIWGAWRPATLLLALVLALAGAPPWLPVTVFLVLYNAGHLTLRWWSFRAGLDEGPDIGVRLGRAGLNRLAGRVFVVGALLLGILMGGLVAGHVSDGAAGWPWSVAAIGAFVLGLGLGRRALFGSTLMLIVVIGVLTVFGAR